MPRYFFHVVEAKSLRTTVRDGEGTVLSDKGAAQKEAVGLARDIATHGVHGSGEWKVVVIDQDGHTILTVPLSEVRARRTRPWHKLRGLMSNILSRQPRAFAWSIAALVVLGIVTTVLVQDRVRYRTASTPRTGAVVAVRFVAQASAENITIFLEAYKGLIVDGPRLGGLYRVRISETTLPQDELKKIAARMAQEQVVEFIAVSQ